ncbi:MAG: phosphoribosylamine--glycine ligase [Alphaproteobacteria bacterium]|nr:phosphoribosylamine--glycine ligase [Alphaproteobacteria bacterium]
MKILIVGSGGREHSLAWRLAASKRVTEIVCAPGNPGMAALARCEPVNADDVEGQVTLAKRERPNLVIVGPEAPLVAGLADRLRAIDVPVFGPSARAAILEGSKAYSKDFMARHAIPTAAHGCFSDPSVAKAFLGRFSAPYVLKADGLAAGKGVVIAQTRREAEDEIDAMLAGKFGTASARIVIEEFMAGEEASFFALCDGETAVALAGAQDHKRVGEGDTGPNTGGMGAYSPAPILDEAMQRRVMEEIVAPTLQGMKAEGRPYRGVLFVGLMIDKTGPRVVEYNCRFGDPECQVIMARLKDDPLPQLLACATGGLDGCARLERFTDHAVSVVMAGAGYPGDSRKGGVIGGLRQAGGVPGVTIFHGATMSRDDEIIANGGRVLNVTAIAPTLSEAVARAYRAVDLIDWPDGFCRRDIGWRALERS